MSGKFKFCSLEFHGSFFQIFSILQLNQWICRYEGLTVFSSLQISRKYINIIYQIYNWYIIYQIYNLVSNKVHQFFYLLDFALTCHVTYCRESLDVASNQKRAAHCHSLYERYKYLRWQRFCGLFLQHDKWHYQYYSWFKYYVYIIDHLHINNYVRGTLENKNFIMFLCSA